MSSADNSLIWSPHVNALSRAGTGKKLKRYIRNTSSAFIKKKAVRKHIFSKFNNMCCQCRSTSNLQIDHIVSVYQANKENIHYINSIDNLQILCILCNSSKLPN